MKGNRRTCIITIGIFIILLSPIILIHAHDVSAQYPDDTSLSAGKATYALRETVCITLTASPEKIVFFNIISPTGIIYTALPAMDHEYQFKPDIAGSYVVNVLLHAGDDETLLTTGFVVVDPKIVFGAPKQGEAVVGEPVNWSQCICVTNHEKFSISNFSVSIPLPPDYSNLSYGAGSTIIDSSIPVDLAAGEGASFNISYQTPPVRLAVAEEMIGISDLIPPDAFDIGVYKEIGVDEGGPQLTDKIAIKQVTVRQNSSIHYHNIPVAIESQGFDEIVEFVDDAGMVAEMITERSNETLSWTIPKLSNRTYMVVGVTREQDDAEIGEPVEWRLNVSGTIVRYKTPAPFIMESKPVIADGMWQKEIVIGSNASVHYSDVTAYSRLGETEKSNLRLFWLANGSRIDVTDSEEFDVSFSDTGCNGIIDRVTWNVPMLSNQSFEVGADITVINVQSYPTVGGNWTVEFETVGCANLTITAVDGTAWSNADEEGDLQFLEIKCGGQTLNYRWINDSVFIENYCCNLTGYEVSKVLTPATHTLQFRFGSDVEYAHNWATDLSGWDYRQPINISNTAGELSYHQVKIELNSSNAGTNWNWTNNGNDTRFTYYNSTARTETEIPFWIESWDSTAQTSTMWVNVTSLANNANTTTYLYYGNTSTSSVSNGTSTFEFFDDFETFTAGNWAKENSASTLSQVSDPAISGRGQVLKYDGNGWYAFEKTTYTFTNGTIHFEFYRPSSNAEIQFCWRIASISSKNLYEFAEKVQVLKFQKFVNNVESKDIHTKSITCPANIWHNSKIVANGSSMEYWVDGTEHLSFSDTSFSSGNLGGRCKYDMYLNDIFVCKYASPEPIASIGSEETPVSLDITISTPQNNSCTNDNTTTFSGTTNIAANITYSVDGDANETACNNCTSFSNTTQELTDGSHNITVYGTTFDNATDTNSETVYFTVDTTPPAPITGLANQSSGRTWINWTWTNPTDADFDHIEVRINETFYANVTQPANFYNATGLDAASWYEIRTRTVDDCQNINTTWVNDTAKTQEVGWWDSSWSYRRVITLQGGDSELTDFPYYIHLSDTTHIQNDGDDLRFLDGLTELKYEIERFETDDVDMWLKVPVLPANEKNISMYYGNSDASSGENRTGVWNSNYKGVWHMPDTNTTVPISIDEVGSVGSVSNLQGVTTDGTYLYASAGDSLYKYWLNNGTSVSSHATTEDSYSHNGDVKYKNGVIYIAVCNYPNTSRRYSVSEYNATDFSFIREHKDLAEYWTAGLDYHDGYWWVLADTGDPNWVHRYNATESGGFDNSSYISYALGNTNSQGITWVGDEIFEANHAGNMGRYHWNGAGFEHVFTYTAGTNFPSGANFQGSDYYNNQLYIARRSAGNIAICKINDSFITNTISDSTSNSNTGTKRASDDPDEVAGRIGYAQDFDGTNDDIGTANSASLKMDGSSWTVESWLNSSASYTDEERMLVEYGTGWVDGCYQLTTTNNHTLKANFEGVSSDAAIYDVDWSDSQWHHAAAVLDNDLNRMYVYYDGNEGTNVIENSTPGTSSDMPMWFACRGGASHFSEVIMDEVRVSDIARSADWLNMSYEVVGNQSGKVTIGTEENRGEGEDTYIPPDPTTLANTTGNFWVNHVWGAGTGNVTDSYNVRVNGDWHNGTAASYSHTYTPHAWQNITVYAYNTSGTGTRSSGNISQDTQIPNNPVMITNTSSWSGDAGANVCVDYDATDADSDTPAYSCNRTGLFTDFDTANGTGSWTAITGTYYVDFGVSDGYGSTDNYTMTIAVDTPSAGHIPPDPKNIQSTAGNFWVNHTWDAGTGNVTNSYNVSVNGAWHNDTTAAYNDTHTPHAWQNITVYAFNTSGNGTLSAGSVSQDTQIPNNAVTITNTSGWSGDAGNNVYVDYDATDADSDTPTYSCNRTGLFTDFDTANGTGSWTAITGTYYVDFGVSDGYGSTDNYTMTIAVGTPAATYIPPDPTTIANTTGNFWVNNTWSAGTGNVTDSYNIFMNGVWHNGTTATFRNATYTPAQWQNITIFAYNTSGMGTLSTGSITQNTQVTGWELWSNIRAIHINNTAGAALTDYQINGVLPGGINETSLRVVNTTSDTVMPHWCANETGGICYKMWFKADNIPGGVWDNDTFKIYYGNDAVSSTSNGTDTFMFFDDFETFNSSVWEKECTAATISTEADPAHTGRGDVLYYNGNWNWCACKRNDYVFTDGIVEFEFWREGGTYDEFQLLWRCNTTDGDFNNSYEFVEKSQTLKFQGFFGGVEVRDMITESITCPAGYWHDGKIIANGSTFEFWVDDTETFSAGAFTNTSFASGYFGVRNDCVQYINNMLVRKYAASEPSATIENQGEGEDTYIPPDPTTIANTTGNFWVNHTWSAGGGNVTDSFNVSMNETWTNDSALTYMNVSVGSDGWANITVWAWNASGAGTLSAGCVSDEVQAPEALLTCTCGDICVNETGWWRGGGVLNGSDTPIQAAVDNASSGETIYVHDGTYSENIDVAKQLTLTGKGADVVNVTNDAANGHVFNVSANYVNISRFNVTGATGNMKAGIYIGNGVGHCNISGNTISDNYIGIHLDSSSSNNRFVDNTISDNTWDNYLVSSTSAFSNNTLNGTKIDFTYCGDISLKGVGSPASDPTEQNNIGKFINATNRSVGAWMCINFSYSDADVSGLDESSLKVWKYNGTAWVEDGWNGSRYLDTANNVVGVNATSFSVFAPMGGSSSCPNCTVSVTPGDLGTKSTGTFTAIINCTDPSGINTSRFFMTRTVEGDMHPGGPPNMWSIRPPVNDIAQSSGSFPQILRAYNRGTGDWYDFAGLFTDNFSYAVQDITSNHVTITNGSTWAKLNYTWVVEPTVFRNNFFLDMKRLEIETKKEYDVYADHPLLVKFWDLEHMRGTANYSVCEFRNINYSGTPTADLKVYYCNDSYKTVSEELPNYGASDATANMSGNVLLMHLDETSGTIVDYSGAGNNGTNNGATYSVPGKINTSLSFDGSDSVNVASSSSLNMGGSDFTIEVWAKSNSTWSAERLLVEHGTWEQGNYQLTTRNSENFKVNFYGRSSHDGCWCSVNWTDGQWHHLVGVLNNSANYLYTYYDGELCAATPETNAPDSVDGPLYIGSRGGTEKFFDGELDEVAAYNRSLSADEIKANYKRGIRKPSSDTDNCACLNTLGTTDLNDIYYTSRNSSYSRSCYDINGNKIAGIDATDTYYIAYASDTAAGNCYAVRYANGSSGTNVSFADSNVAWSSTDDADNWIQAQFTPDLWFSAITDGDQFQLGVYAESNVGSNYTNFTLYTDDIGDINYPISNPSIAYYENADDTKDYDLTGPYAGDMTINVNMAKDPDAPGTVKHSLYLYNSNGMLNTTIDSSFYSQDDSNVNVIFDTSTVSDAEYRIKVTAVADDNSSDVESYLTTVNFTIDNTVPTIQLNDPADKADLSSSTVNFNWTVTDTLDGTLSCDLAIDGATNQSGITSISGQPTNYSVSGISNGHHNWYMTCRDDAANAVTSETRKFGINDRAPDVTLNRPLNGSVIPNNWVILNATVTDADDDNMTVCFYANDGINGLNTSEGLVYIEENVADGSTITYNLTALPVKPDEEGLAMLMHFDNKGEYGEHTERGVANAVYDFTGNGNNGTLGSATTSTAPVRNVTGGKFAGAFEFDGSDDYIDCGDDSSLNLDNSSFTVSLWFNTRSNTVGDRQTLLSKGSTHTNNGTCLHLDLFRNENEIINLRFWGDDLEVNTTITANTWHHAAFTYNTSNMNQTIYLDGACVGSGNIATNLTGTNGDSIWIGRRACGKNDNSFNGAIDEVALYTRTLSETEILNQYRLEKGKYYWKVNTTDSVLSNESDVWNFYAGHNPDLQVINVTFDQWNTSENRSAISETGTGYHVKENRNITINVTIANYANENVTSNFDVSFFDSAGVSGNWSRCLWNSTYNVSTEGELGNVTTGYPHNTTYITGYWNPSLVGTHNISVWVNPANSASESAANTTNNNASAVINVSAWQKYYGNVSGSIVLADSVSDSLYDWTWSNETDVGYAYIVKNGASINWSDLHALGCDSNNTLNASGHDFLDADTNLGMVVGSNTATGFVDNNITELFSGGGPSTASFMASFTVYGNLISNVPIVNSTIMVNHTSVESANFVTGILWDATSDTNGYYDATNETLVFVTKIRVAATGLGGAAHNYEFAAPCTLNPVVGGDLDVYMELK